MDIRCKNCGYLFMKEPVIVIGEIKCHRCKTINKINVVSQGGVAKNSQCGIMPSRGHLDPDQAHFRIRHY